MGKNKKTRKQKRSRMRGGGGGFSKPKATTAPARPAATVAAAVAEIPKRVFLFDMDDTLLFRRDVTGQYSLHLQRVAKGLAGKNDPYKATAEHVKPRPDFFFEPSSTLFYLRPGVKEALAYAKAHADQVHAFSASTDADGILTYTGLRPYFDKVFTRHGFTTFEIRGGSPTVLKNLGSVRENLGLKPTDELYMFDDHPEWIVPSGPHDHVVAITPFQPAYRLYDVATIKNPGLDEPTNAVPVDTVVMDAIIAALR